MSNVPTPHNSGKMGDFAKTVLMPGDPLRAKYIAETYLDNPRQVNGVRNMLGYTEPIMGKKFQSWVRAWVCPPLEFIPMSFSIFMMWTILSVSVLRELCRMG